MPADGHAGTAGPTAGPAGARSEDALWHRLRGADEPQLHRALPRDEPRPGPQPGAQGPRKIKIYFQQHGALLILRID